MRIDARGARVTGKMLAATQDTLLAHGAVECPGVTDDGVDVEAPGPVLQRIVDVVAKGNIEHRREVEIKAEKPQDFARKRAVPLDQAQVALLAQLFRARRLRAAFLQARDPSALLVDGDDGLMLHLAAKIVDELAQLRRGLDVAPEKDEARGLNFADDGRCLCVEFRTRHAHEDVMSAVHRLFIQASGQNSPLDSSADFASVP